MIDGLGPALVSDDDAIVYHFRADNSGLTAPYAGATLIPVRAGDFFDVTPGKKIVGPEVFHNYSEYDFSGDGGFANQLGSSFSFNGSYDDGGGPLPYTAVDPGFVRLSGGAIGINEMASGDPLWGEINQGGGGFRINSSDVSSVIYTPHHVDNNGVVEALLQTFSGAIVDPDLFDADGEPDQAKIDAYKAQLVIDDGSGDTVTEALALEMGYANGWNEMSTKVAQGFWAVVLAEPGSQTALQFIDDQGEPRWVELITGYTIAEVTQQISTLSLPYVAGFGAIKDAAPDLGTLQGQLATAYGVAREDMTPEQLGLLNALDEAFVRLVSSDPSLETYHTLVTETFDFDGAASYLSSRVDSSVPVSIYNNWQPDGLLNSINSYNFNPNFEPGTTITLDLTNLGSVNTQLGQFGNASNLVLANYNPNSTVNIEAGADFNGVPPITFYGGDFNLNISTSEIAAGSQITLEAGAVVGLNQQLYDHLSFQSDAFSGVDVRVNSSGTPFVGTDGNDEITVDASGDYTLSGGDGVDSFSIMQGGNVTITDFDPNPDAVFGAREYWEIQLNSGNWIDSTDTSAGVDLVADGFVTDEAQMSGYAWGTNGAAGDEFAQFGNKIYHQSGTLTVEGPERIPDGMVANPFEVVEIPNERYGDIITFGVKLKDDMAQTAFSSLDLKVDWADGEYKFWGGFESGSGIDNQDPQQLATTPVMQLESYNSNQSEITIGTISNSGFSFAPHADFDGTYAATFMLERIDNSGATQNDIRIEIADFTEADNGVDIPRDLIGAPQTFTFDYDQDQINLSVETHGGKVTPNLRAYVTNGSVTDGLTIVPVARFGDFTKYELQLNVSKPTTMVETAIVPNSQEIIIKGDIFDHSFRMIDVGDRARDTAPNDTSTAVGGAFANATSPEAANIDLVVGKQDFVETMHDVAYERDWDARAQLTTVSEVYVGVSGLNEPDNPGSYSIAEFWAVDPDSGSDPSITFVNDFNTYMEIDIVGYDVSGKTWSKSVDDGSDFAVASDAIYINPGDSANALGSEDALGALRVMLNQKTYTNEEIIAADFNKSGAVDVMDVYGILNYTVNGYDGYSGVAGENILPTWVLQENIGAVDTVTPNSVTFGNDASLFVGDVVNLDVTAVLRGDVSATYGKVVGKDVSKAYAYDVADWVIHSPHINLASHDYALVKVDGYTTHTDDYLSVAAVDGGLDGMSYQTEFNGDMTDNAIHFRAANSIGDVEAIMDLMESEGNGIIQNDGNAITAVFTYDGTEETSIWTVQKQGTVHVGQERFYVGDLDGYNLSSGSMVGLEAVWEFGIFPYFDWSENSPGGFSAGAGGDVYDLDLSQVVADTGITSLEMLDGRAVAVGDVLSIADAPPSAAFTVPAAGMLFISGDFASAEVLETALEAGGNNEMTTVNAFSVGDAFLAVYDDGTDSYLATVETSTGAFAGGTFAAGDLNVTNVFTFAGVSDADMIVSDNISII